MSYRDRVDVFWADLNIEIEKNILDHWRNLSKIEKELLRNIGELESKNRFIVQRSILREVLSKYSRRRPGDVSFVRVPSGKLNSSIVDCNFSVSHSISQFGVAVYGGGRVGIDVEDLGQTLDFLSLVGRYYTKRERQILADLELEELERVFFRIWTRKEAIAKGAEISLIDVLEVDDEEFWSPAERQVIRNPRFGKAEWTLLRVKVPNDPSCIAYLAVEGTKASSCEFKRWTELR